MSSANARGEGSIGNSRSNGHGMRWTEQNDGIRPSTRPTAWWPPRWSNAGRRPSSARRNSRRRMSASCGRRPRTYRHRSGSGSPRWPPLSLPGGRRRPQPIAIGKRGCAVWWNAWSSTSNVTVHMCRSLSRGPAARAAITRYPSGTHLRPVARRGHPHASYAGVTHAGSHHGADGDDPEDGRVCPPETLPALQQSTGLPTLSTARVRG